MVIEEDSVAVAPARPDELITLQPQGRFRWLVQHMPHSGSAAGGSTLISRQSGIPSTSTTRSMEEEASVVQAVTESAESAEPAIVGSIAAQKQSQQ